MLTQGNDVARDKGHPLDWQMLSAFFVLLGVNAVPERGPNNNCRRHNSCYSLFPGSGTVTGSGSVFLFPDDGGAAAFKFPSEFCLLPSVFLLFISR